MLGGPGAQAHLPAPGGVQHCAGPALHQEADRHADLHHDQGDGQVRPGQGARDQQPCAQGGHQQ